MGMFTQANRSMALTTPLGDDALLLARLTGDEGLSRPFCFRLELLAEQPVSFDRLMGQTATVRLDVPGCPRRLVNGIISRLTQLGQVTASQGLVTFIRYRAELVPRLWLLSHRANSRIFQRMTVPEILTQVFREWQLNVQLALADRHPRREYCVQYRETDLAFVSRLMEAEGIWYFFAHEQDKHTLVLGDGPAAHPELPVASQLTYDVGTGGQRHPLRITGWEKTQELRACKYSLRGHSFELPDSDLEARVAIQDSARAGTVDHSLAHDVSVTDGNGLEIFDYPGGYGRRFDSVDPGGADQMDELQHLFTDNERTTRLRMQEEAARVLTIAGTSNCGHLLPGYRFELTGHFDGDGPYILTTVEHTADLEASYLGGPGEITFLYENRLRALPLALPYRPPRRTPRPTIPGTQPATVVGPGGDDLFLDKYGRVKVKFRWDRRSDVGAESSCWIRVSQFWAGQRWGAFFWPRVGHEVIVAFEEGDPDRPIIVGSVYNGKNMPPFTLPEHGLLDGIKSFSASGSILSPLNPLANYNGILFDDRPGQEHVELHGERHIIFNSENDHQHNVNGPHRLNVADFHSVHVGRLTAPGSGSGGGAFKFSTTTDMSKILGVALSSVNGMNASTVLGLAASLTVGANVSVIVNPSAVLTEVLGVPTSPIAGPIAAGFLGAFAPFLGATNMVAGDQVNLNYGSKLVALRGVRPIVNDVRNIKSTECKVQMVGAALVAGLATAGLITAGIQAYDTQQQAWQIVMETTAAAVGALALVDSTFCHVMHAKNLATAAQAAALATNGQAMNRTADALTNLFVANQQNVDKLTRISGTRAEYADAVIQGADVAQLLYAGTAATQMSVLAMDSSTIKLAQSPLATGPRITLDATANTITLAAGPLLTGPRITLDATANTITLAVGPAANGPSITLDAVGSIILQTGAAASTKITLNGNSIILNTAAGANTLNVSQTGLAIQVLEYSLKASANAAQQFLVLDQTVTAALKTAVGIEQED